MTTYDLHGILGIELVDADERDTRAVDRQLGPIRGPLPAGPRISIRFVDRLPLKPLRLTGVRESGHDGTHFAVLRSSHKVPARVVVPVLDARSPTIEFLVERGVPSIPLLIPMINLTALSVGVVPLHAAAFEADHGGVLVTGWSKGGKTETLLAFLGHGARYIGDEWIYVRRDGTMAGIPEPIRLWSWHLDQLPEVFARLSLGDRLRLRGTVAGHAALRAVGRVKAARRGANLLRSQRYVDADPARVTGRQPSHSQWVGIDAVVFVGSWTDPQVAVRPMSPAEVVDRIVHSLAYERRDLVARAWEQRFNEPGRRSSLLDDASDIERETLMAALDGRTTVALDHPYPVEIDALYRELAPVLGGTTT